MRADFPYLIPDRDRHGVVRYYVRRHGRKIRIREKPGTEAFALAYAEALAAFDPGAAASSATPSNSHPWAPLAGWRPVISRPPNSGGSIRNHSGSGVPLSRIVCGSRANRARMI